MQGEAMDPTGLAALLKRAQVLASSALTWLTAIAVVLSVAIEQLDDIASVPDVLIQWLVRAAAFLAVVILQVRRVTPVDDSQKGLLPPKGPAVEVADAPRDAGSVNVSTLLLVLAFVCLVVFTLIAHGTFVTDEGLTWLGAGLSLWVLAGLAP